MDYFIGNIVGICQVIIGHPFDTLKTNIQNSHGITIFIKHPLKLYQGIKYPLITNGINTSILFGNYDYIYKKTNNRIISGMLTGAIGSLIITPFDYRKIHIQYYGTKHDSIMMQKYSHETLINKITRYYTGIGYTLCRETISIPVYFGSFYYLNEHINPFLAGGIAGCNSWLCTYPIDTLKTRKQLLEKGTVWELIKMGNLFNGLFITLLRAFIVNGSSFLMYDYINKKIKNDIY
jgi:solute carrier family 25 carnitine/acylcarnitine transporter 20/29